MRIPSPGWPPPRHLLWLPTASNMKDGDVEYVADTVRKALGGER